MVRVESREGQVAEATSIKHLQPPNLAPVLKDVG